MMSPDQQRRRFRLRGHITNVAVLAFVWVMLNGNASLLTLLSGVLLGLLVTWFFPLPFIEWGGRLRPFGFLALIGRLLFDLAVASTRLALYAFRRRPVLHTAVIGVKLNTDADLYQVGTGSILSVVPGSVVIDARRKTRTLYLHLFNTSVDMLDEERRRALAAERRILRAFASNEELRLARENSHRGEQRS